MGYRGSKSDFISKSVKEKRVDGSWHKRNSLVFKMYSNGFQKKLSSQNPFLTNVFMGYNNNFIRGITSI